MMSETHGPWRILFNKVFIRAPGQPTVAEQLAGPKLQSQFERALAKLGVELIHAHSPQAKGRVERLFKTLQDRLVKDLRLAAIATIEAANRFMEHGTVAVPLPPQLGGAARADC
jgi:hypothetical protein